MWRVNDANAPTIIPSLDASSVVPHDQAHTISKGITPNVAMPMIEIRLGMECMFLRLLNGIYFV